MTPPPDVSGANVWLDILALHRIQRSLDMETRTITPFADQLADASTRRTAVKRFGALALGTLAIAAVGRSAAAKQNNHHNHNPHQNGQQDCLNRCQGHNQNRCHQRCRRNRANV